MGTKKQDNTIITEEEKIAGQDQGGSIVPQKDISSPPTVKNPSPKQGEVGDDLQDAIKRHSDPTYKVDKIIDKPSISSPPKQGEVKPTFDMQTMINDLNDREETARKQNEEERKKEAKTHRARSIISAIGDGLSGLANIYFTTKGAPDMLKGTTSLSAKQQERWDKIRKERESRRDAYLKAVRDDNKESLKNAYTQWKDDRDYEMEVRQEERQKRQAEVKAMKDEAMALYYNNKASKEEYLAMVKAAEAGDYDKFSKLREREAESRINKNNAQAAKAGKSGGSGSKNTPSVGKNYITVFENEYKLDGNGDILYKKGRPIVVGKRTRRLYKGTPEYEEHIGNRRRGKGWSAKK